ncbi:MAG: phage/plasmid primase, P4 family [Prosthecobacter sp.]|uniref:phage/plasmid primase, P4 family n=1 Tax=Prosthecobacter sp. TaxID=1965333 RepID=UPI003BAEE275
MAREASFFGLTAKAVYWMLNPLPFNWSGKPAKDPDVVHRRWLLLDIDPKREGTISATCEEKNYARIKMTDVNNFLAGRGWPAPIICDSGNGWHALYRVDVLGDDSGLIRRVLQALAEKFDDDFVHVDTVVANASRICKLYGTVGRKGPNTLERPHRASGIITIPEQIGVVATELLEQLASTCAVVKVKEPRLAAQRAGARTPAAPKAGPKITLNRPRAYASKVPGAVSGQGGSQVTFNLAIALVRGFHLDIEDAYTILAEWSERCCVPPWSEKELRHKISDADNHDDPENPRGYLLTKRKPAPPTAKPLWLYSSSDLGNADALVDAIQGMGVYCPEIGMWLTFEQRWRRDYSNQIRTKAADFVRASTKAAAAVVEEATRSRALKRALSLGDLKPMCNAITLAANNPKVIVHLKQLDADSWLLGVDNGTLDLRTGQLVETPAEAYVTRGMETAFDPLATCPLWEAFIERVTRGYDGLAEFIQRSVGYSLTGLTVEHLFWFLYGDGNNGKSTFIETLQKLFGEYGIRASEKLLSLSKHGADTPQNEIAALHGGRILFGSETKEGDRLNEKFIKDLTGGDTVYGRSLWKEGVQFAPTCSLWMFGNHKPSISGTDRGIWRRVQLIPFTATLTAEEIDLDLKDKMKAVELPGILNWAIRGLRQWQGAMSVGGSKLGAPCCVTGATSEYRKDQDTLGLFLDEHVVTVAGARTKKADLYMEYRLWATDNGQNYTMTKNTLTLRMKDRGFVELPTRPPTWADVKLQ